MLTATQVRAINNATKAPGRIAIRIGSGSAAACGLFAVPTPTLFATIAVGVHPENVTIDRTGVWIVNSRDGTLSRIDTKTNSVVLVSPRLRPYSLTPYAVTSGFGSIWVTMLSSIGAGASQNAGFVVRINPATGAAIGSPIPIGPSPLAIAASADAIWVANYDAATVTRIDPTMNKVTTAIPVSERPSGIVAGFGAIWVSNGAGHVVRIDPTTKSVVSTIATQASPTSQPLAAGLAVGAGSVWAVNYGTDNQSDGSVSRIDPSTNSVVATIPGLRNPVQLAFGGGYLWAGMWAPWLVQIDPAANTVKYQVGVGVRLAGGAVASSVSWGVAATDHAVWVVHPYYAGVPADRNLPGVVSRVNF